MPDRHACWVRFPACDHVFRAQCEHPPAETAFVMWQAPAGLRCPYEECGGGGEGLPLRVVTSVERAGEHEEIDRALRYVIEKNHDSTGD